VAEQLVYEIGDPAHYLTPDVDADFSAVELRPAGPDRVQVCNARGAPAPARYKVSLAFRGGWMAAATLVVAGANSVERARQCGQLVLSRLAEAGIQPARSRVEVLGAGDSLPGVWPPRPNPWEVVVRVAIEDASRPVVERFVREFSPLVASGPPGVSGYTGPRPAPWPVVAFWPSTIAREHVASKVDVNSAEQWATGSLKQPD
jgi:hypothetical protein